MRAVRTLLVLGSTVALLVGATSASAGGAPGERDPEDKTARGGGALAPTLAAENAAALAALNDYRTDAGLPPLTTHYWVDYDATQWASSSAAAGTSGPSPTAADDAAPFVVHGELYATGPASAGVGALVDQVENAAPSIVYSTAASWAGVGYATNGSGQAYLYIVVAQDPFVDVVPGDPFDDEILDLVSWGVVTGWPDGTFRPTAPVTREAMAAFLYRFWDLDPYLPPCDPSAAQPFTDVSTGHPFCGAIAWLDDTGISTGYPDGTFRPGQNVTREAMAAFIYRWWLEWTNSTDPMPTCDPAAPRMFTDVSAGHPFCGAIEWLASNDITSGWPDGTFRPGQTIERQAMSAFLVRFDSML